MAAVKIYQQKGHQRSLSERGLDTLLMRIKEISASVHESESGEREAYLFVWTTQMQQRGTVCVCVCYGLLLDAHSLSVDLQTFAICEKCMAGMVAHRMGVGCILSVPLEKGKGVEE